MCMYSISSSSQTIKGHCSTMAPGQVRVAFVRISQSNANRIPKLVSRRRRINGLALHINVDSMVNLHMCLIRRAATLMSFRCVIEGAVDNVNPGDEC